MDSVDLLGVLGISCVIGGVAAIYWPLAVILLGFFLIIGCGALAKAQVAAQVESQAQSREEK